MLPRAFAALCVLLSASCAVDESHRDSGLYYLNSRTFEVLSWDTVANIGGGLSDTILVMPQMIAADGGVLFVYDVSDSRVRAIGPAGDLLWTYGRRGEGPGEFMNVIDMEVGSDSTLRMLDGGTNRLTVVRRDGSWLRSIPIAGVRTRDVIPGDSVPLLLTVASEDFLIAVDSAGAILRRGDPPTPEIEQASPLVRQTLASGTARGEPGTEQIWATIFPFGHPLVVYEGERVRCTARLIEANFQGQTARPGTGAASDGYY